MKEAVVEPALRYRTTNTHKMISLLKTFDINLVFHLYTGYTCSLYGRLKSAYRAPAKDNHRITMSVFLSGALDTFECTLKRVLSRSSG
ncbi:MAG: hypothetical protein ACI85N_002410 [Gammaproteobacteria bacterium]|jgi:hypothetical protein